MYVRKMRMQAESRIVGIKLDGNEYAAQLLNESGLFTIQDLQNICVF